MRREDVIRNVKLIEENVRALARSQNPMLDAFQNPAIFEGLVAPEKSDLVRVQIHHLCDSMLKVINDAEALQKTLKGEETLEKVAL